MCIIRGQSRLRTSLYLEHIRFFLKLVHFTERYIFSIFPLPFPFCRRHHYRVYLHHHHTIITIIIIIIITTTTIIIIIITTIVMAAFRKMTWDQKLSKLNLNFFRNLKFKWRYEHNSTIYIIRIYPTPLECAVCDTRPIFELSKTGLNSEFSFWTSLPNYLPTSGSRKDSCLSYGHWRKGKTVVSRI